MCYLEEARELIAKCKQRDLEVQERYKDHFIPAGQLDGDPADEEMHANTRWFSAELKRLREKYPDWKKEVAQDAKLDPSARRL